MPAGTTDSEMWLDMGIYETHSNAPSDLVKKWAQVIIERYSEAWRYYHILTHISDMMKHFGRWKERIKDKNAVILAILFHDIIYDPKSSTNEKDSIEVFKQFAAETSIPPVLSDRVVQLITATITHQTDNFHDTDLDFFLDFDMAVLGQPEKEYRAYAGAIKKEYSHIGDSLYCAGRTQVLQSFLERPQIFFTLPFREMFEAQARENLKQEIEALRLPPLSSL